MRRIALFVMLLPAYAAAEPWSRLTGQAAHDALSGNALRYESGATQSFNHSGRTLYNAGEDSWGYWGIRDDRYCSMWPPSDLWACYDLYGADGRIRFVGDGGNVTDGDYIE